MNDIRRDLQACISTRFPQMEAPRETRVQEHFYVRAGPQTELLGTRQALSYISNHFSDQGG